MWVTNIWRKNIFMQLLEKNKIIILKFYFLEQNIYYVENPINEDHALIVQISCLTVAYKSFWIKKSMTT